MCWEPELSDNSSKESNFELQEKLTKRQNIFLVESFRKR